MTDRVFVLGMGEAKRRRAAGTYPSRTDENPTVGDGMVAITMDVDDAIVPVTMEFDAGTLATLMDHPSSPMCGNVTGRVLTYEEVCRTIQLNMRNGSVKTPDDTASMALCAIWSTLHAPEGGPALRRRLSERLRIDGSVHITWRMSKGGLAISCGGKQLDLRDVEPIGTGVLFESEAQPEPPAN